MDPFSTAGLASSIVQFIEFGLNLFSRSKKLYQSSQEALPENIDTEIIARDLLSHVERIKAYATLSRHDTTEQLKQLTEACTSTAEKLLSDLERLKLKEKGKKWPTFKAAMMTVCKKPEIEALQRQLDAMKQELQLFGIVSLMEECVRSAKAAEAIHLDIKDTQMRLQSIAEDARTIKTLFSERPRDLGFPWETGQPEDHVQVDDGLGQNFYLPVDLCYSPEIFKSTMELKYSSRKLPGLRQVQSGHFVTFNWNETTAINPDNWSSSVTRRKGIKLSFMMGIWHVMPRGKCLRCFKPRKEFVDIRCHQICHSCGLQVLHVEPGTFPFEPQNVSIGMGPDAYRDHQLKPRSKTTVQFKIQNTNIPTQYLEQSGPINESCSEIPPIDFVCRRLVIQWEPIFNIVHRYVYCRCVIRLSTPSRWDDECTIFVLATCPRHNNAGMTRLDYGNMDYQQDPYFDRYGGYDSFRALAYRNRKLYELLGTEKFLAEKDVCAARDSLQRHEDSNPGAFENLAREYLFEVNSTLQKHGFHLPPEIAQDLEAEKLRKEKEERSGIGGADFELSQAQRVEIQNSPITRELHEILKGEWSGKPHWVIDK